MSMRLTFFTASVNLSILVWSGRQIHEHAHYMHTQCTLISTQCTLIYTQYTITGVLHRDMLNAQRILSFSHIAHAVFFTDYACALILRNNAVLSLLLLSITRHRHLHTRLVLASSLWPREPVGH